MFLKNVNLGGTQVSLVFNESWENLFIMATTEHELEEKTSLRAEEEVKPPTNFSRVKSNLSQVIIKRIST